jgi:hypothetical protein
MLAWSPALTVTVTVNVNRSAAVGGTAQVAAGEHHAERERAGRHLSS